MTTSGISWQRRRLHPFVSIAFLVAFLSPSAAMAGEWAVRLQFSKHVHSTPYTGRVYVFFSRFSEEPRKGPDWFRPEPFVAKDVENWKSDQPLTLSSSETNSLLSYPGPTADFDPTGYRAQAVVRFNRHERKVGTGVGNGYSQPVLFENSSEPLLLAVDRLVEEAPFVETERIKLLRVRSKLLSDFHGRDVFLQAAVTLPPSYDASPERRYPTIFEVPGFGGTHRDVFKRAADDGAPAGGVEFLHVLLDPSCPLGHHVFADSANNGPVGTALVTEFIPEFERAYRAFAGGSARFLTGHSSGGWSSLWLQVNYPEQFAGTWSTSPDSVDFRDYQRIDLYRPGENMYFDAKGERRPIARAGGQVLLWYQDFANMEETLGPGGQLHSFEAVFSPRGDDGKPLLLWDRRTGKIDSAVAKTWQKYDNRLLLETNWKTLGPKLQGKLHVFMGGVDTFYLEGATMLLKQSLASLGSDAVVEIHADRTHGDLLTAELRQRIRREMADAFLKSHPDYKK
ncbi:MAG: alpha/beta hydrolase-fold protein [Planctomycetaceae bacterium]